jgi:pimeloyl-ACP methyl ester carboxylesterase
MRFRLITVWFAVAALAGCSAMTPGRVDSVEPVSDAPRAGNVYLLRGFIGVFSTGIDRLGTEVNAVGVHADVFQDDQWSVLADQIALRYHGHPDAEPLVLVGHSYGADDSIRIARKLDAANIPVNLLITLDPVTPPAIPKNVRLCVNLYQSNGIWDNLPWLRGIPLEQDAGSTGKLFNFNIRTDRRDLLDPDVNHFNIEKKQKIHDEVLRLVLAVCPTRQQWTMTHSGPSRGAQSVAVIHPRPAPAVAPASAIITASARDTSN